MVRVDITDSRISTDKSSKFLGAAIEVGDQMLALAFVKDGLTIWKSIEPGTGTVSLDRTDLYSGTSGIALFLLELYKQTGHKRYLEVAQIALRDAARQEEASPHPHPAFLTGRMGVAYALLKLYEVTGRQADLRQALALARTCRQPTVSLQEYINGNAGSLLAFMHLHAATGAPWLLEAINDYAGYILQRAQPATIGVCWDRGPYEVRPLCGFSHGTSGIGFAFLELGYYLKNPAYFEVAKQAFAYEDSYFDQQTGNWPDFRLHMWKPEQRAALQEAYLQGDTSEFTKAGNMAAWCHGAPGIALARIRGYQLTHKGAYLTDLRRALLTTKVVPAHDIPLCHGQAGNLDSQIVAYMSLGRKRAWTDAQATGQRLLVDWQSILHKMQADHDFADSRVLGLLTGLAGVGYSFLRLHDPQATPSILAPSLTATISKPPAGSHTFLHLDDLAVQQALTAPKSHGDPAAQSFKQDMLAHYPSNGLLFTKAELRRERLRSILELSDRQLLEQTFWLDEDCRLHVTPAKRAILFRYTIYGIEERTISPFCHLVLNTFRKPQTVNEAIAAINKRYGNLPEAQQQLLRSKVLEQIREGLRAMLLVNI